MHKDIRKYEILVFEAEKKKYFSKHDMKSRSHSKLIK